jgi:nucleotide-binding universal stress UspA family protein
MTGASAGDDAGGAPVIVLAYDGSPSADRAVQYAGRFLSAARAVILTVWVPMDRGGEPVRSGYAFDLDGPPDPPADAEEDIALAEARRVNGAGVELALAAGLPAEPWCAAQTVAPWQTILDVAEEVGADLIVTGTRAITGFRSLLQSSVADQVLRRGHRPVLIVPPAP